MKKRLKCAINSKTYVIIVIVILVIAFPFLLNSLILIESGKAFVGKDADWLLFWGSYVSAIASFAMVYITYNALKLNKESLGELKRQWDEQNRPRLHFTIVSIDSIYYLKIENSGNEDAYNISLKFSSNFVDNHYHENIKNQFIKLQEIKFYIEKHKSKHYRISLNYDMNKKDIDSNGSEIPYCKRKDWLDNYKNEKIEITGSYCNGKYNINESFAIINFLNHAEKFKDEK